MTAYLNDSCNNTFGKFEMITLLSPSLRSGVKTRVTSASPLYRLTFVILLSVGEVSSTALIWGLAIGKQEWLKEFTVTAYQSWICWQPGAAVLRF